MDLHKIEGRVAVLGIGNVLRGDDGVGPRIARALTLMRLHRDWLIIDAGIAPEAYAARIRDFGPDLVILVDAVEMGAAPGQVAWFDAWQSDQVSAWTHGLPLEVLAEFLGCRVVLLGIQPETKEFGVRRLSPAVRAATMHILVSLRQALAADALGHRHNREYWGVTKRPGE